MNNKRLKLALLFTRLSIFSVILFWTIDKFIQPKHASAIFDKYYNLGEIGHNIIYVIAALELLLLLFFLIGFKKRFSYGLILLMHLGSTLAAYNKYLSPFDGNLLFFAAWPMLAACILLYLMRDQDTFMTLPSRY